MKERLWEGEDVTGSRHSFVVSGPRCHAFHPSSEPLGDSVLLSSG